MNAYHIFLGHPWKSNRDTHHSGRNNTYSFYFKCKKCGSFSFVIEECNSGQNCRATCSYCRAFSCANSSCYSQSTQFLSRSSLENAIHDEEILNFLLLVESVKTVSNNSKVDDNKLKKFLKEFNNVFPTNLSSEIPRLRGIEHQINLMPSAPLPNKLAYMCNPKEIEELQF